MKFQAHKSLGLLLLLSGSISSLQGQLIHRYSFSNAAGEATGGILTDSVGGSHGTVLGAGALFTGTALDLPGGSSDTAAYGDLPNNLVSTQTAVTIEGWVTIDGNAGPWGRIFDFGSTEPGGGSGKITGPGNTNGGGTTGLDYFILTASRGNNYNQQRIEIRNEDPGGGGIGTFDSDVATVFGEQIHYAVTWKDTGLGTSQISYWRDGVLLADSVSVNSNLSDLNDVNSWLGRSAWLNDANLDATYDEFRIYEEALTEQQISASRSAGPDVVVDLNDDTDGDMIPTAYEDLHDFLDPNNASDALLDEDSDGLNNLEEFQKKTVPDDADSDDDGLNDGPEVNTHMTNPLSEDSDGDGLTDGTEIKTTNTLPLKADSDDDGIPDGPEIAGGLDPMVADATNPNLLHRYSFNAAAGNADESAVVTDSIGGADGTVVGANGLWTGSALTLPGGDGATADAAYVDLPNHLISSLDHLTFEAWYSVTSLQNWGRVWDFGSTDGGEVFNGMSGATQGQDYFVFAPNRGTNPNTQRTTIRNLDTLAPGGGTGPVDGTEEAADTNLESILGQEYHFASVWTSDGSGGGQLTVYRDGIRQETRATTFTPKDINDVNNWLGRSNWTGDAYFHGDLNEFRIYEGAMNDAAAAASFAAGPDAALGAGSLQITSLSYDKDADTFTLSFTSTPGRFYSVFSSTDLVDFGNELIDGIPATGTSTTVGPFDNPSPVAKRLFFRVGVVK